MCLGSVVWSGVREVLASAQPEDVENIVGFDEGPALPIMTSSWKNVESASFLRFSGKKDVQSCKGMSNWKVLFIILPGTPESSLFHKIFPPETILAGVLACSRSSLEKILLSIKTVSKTSSSISFIAQMGCESSFPFPISFSNWTFHPRNRFF